MNTIKYKNHFIHINFMDPSNEIIRFQKDGEYNTYRAKSLHSAKILITNRINNG